MSDAAILALRATGWSAALLLLATLTTTPLARIPSLRGLVRQRRRLGIATALTALAHATTALVVYLPHGAWASVTHVTWLRSGALALSVLSTLLVTSFPPVTRALRVVLWKPLHRLVYVAPVLVVHHLVLAPFAPRSWALVLGAAFLLTLAARLVPRRAAPDAP